MKSILRDMLSKIHNKSGNDIVRHDTLKDYLGRILHIPKPYRNILINYMCQIRYLKRINKGSYEIKIKRINETFINKEEVD